MKSANSGAQFLLPKSPFYQFHFAALNSSICQDFSFWGLNSWGKKNRSWLTWPPQSLGGHRTWSSLPIPLKSHPGPAAPRPSDSQRSRWNRSDETWVFLMGPLKRVPGWVPWWRELLGCKLWSWITIVTIVGFLSTYRWLLRTYRVYVFWHNEWKMNENRQV